MTRVLIGTIVTVSILVVAGLLIARPGTSCPSNWIDAQRIIVPGSSRDVSLASRAYRVGGSATLDYMPRGFSNPLELWLYQLTHGERHGLAITASVSAISRDALGDPQFTCFRAIHGSDVWAVRPMNYGTQTSADGYPPGAPSPVPNEAWRQSSHLSSL